MNEHADGVDPDQLMRHSVARVLLNEDGAIVALWDDGRWWTPGESAAYLAKIVAEHKASEEER